MGRISETRSALTLVRAANIAIERGGRRLFSGLSFEVSQGEALVVTGPNGAGKSSLLRALAGLLPLAEGAFAHAGGEPDASLAEQAHYLSHRDALKEALTAGENLEFWAAMLDPLPNPPPLRGRGGGERGAWDSLSREAGEGWGGGLPAGPALEQLGLAHVIDLPVNVLSAGQKRRVALARLLVARRPLWLLDEPLTALDLVAQKRFAAILRDHLDGGGLIVAATHADLGLDNARELRLGMVEAAVI